LSKQCSTARRNYLVAIAYKSFSVCFSVSAYTSFGQKQISFADILSALFDQVLF